MIADKIDVNNLERGFVEHLEVFNNNFWCRKYVSKQQINVIKRFQNLRLRTGKFAVPASSPL